MTTLSKKSAASDALRSANEFALSGDPGRALANATEKWFAATTECQREMMGFVSMRLEKDGETLREMMGCKKLADAATIRCQWIEDTIRDYTSEMAKVMAIDTRSVNGEGRAGG